jgi:uncharacterized protein YuzB (UPF0349 family)
MASTTVSDSSMHPPFIIYGLPRSRTAWLSMFLSYGDWTCHHEKAMYLRSMQDVKDLFLTPNTGSAETGAPYGRCLLKYLVPDIKEVVVLRPVQEVMTSLLRIDFGGQFTFDEVKLRKIIEKGDRALRKIARDPSVLVVEYADLENEETCARVFEFCLPYAFDGEWWRYFHEKNIQVDLRELFSYRYQNKSAIDGFKSLCKRELLRLCRMGEIPLNGVA